MERLTMRQWRGVGELHLSELLKLAGLKLAGLKLVWPKPSVLAWSGASLGLLLSIAAPLLAQKAPSETCLPPAPNEYLLLAVTPTLASQATLQAKAPKEATAIVCRYLDNTVTRMGGFGTEALATAWAQYLTRTTGLQVTIARPTMIATPPTITTKPPQATPSPTPPPNHPKPHGNGYAVLVIYNNRPEVATQLNQALNTPIGVVAYEERPYLLATQTPDAAAANAIKHRHRRNRRSILPPHYERAARPVCSK